MYTVVVCSNCKFVWIAKDRPKRSECGKCGKTRKFSKLKKYYHDEDLAIAQLARAQVQARVHDQEDRFDDALERGVLQEELESAFHPDEYISGQGIDAEKVREHVDRMLIAPDSSKSRREIVLHGIRKQDSPNLADFIDYSEGHGLDDDEAVLLLEKFVRAGKLTLPEQISMAELEMRSEEALNADDDNTPDSIEYSEKGEQDKQPKTKTVLLEGIAEAGPEVEAVIGYAVSRGMSPENAVLRLEKLARTGESTAIELSDVEEIAAEILGEDLYEETSAENDTEDPDTENSTGSEQIRGSRSRREIMTDAFRDIDNPCREDVIEYATRNGVSPDKAQQYLEKMIQRGEVTKTASSELRIL